METIFIFTNFNNSRYSIEAVESIMANSNSSSLVLIVDNNSDNENVKLLESLDANNSNVDIIYNKRNIGYFGGLNVGIRFVREKFGGCQYLIIGNNDLVFPVNFVQSILSKKVLFERYPVISPDIVTLDGFHQNPHVVKEISTFREFIYDVYHFNYYLAILIKKIARLTNSFTDRKDELQYELAQEIYQGYGACYILGPLFFENFEELWNPTFIMHEEFFLSKQLEEKGFNVFYEPSIRIEHHWHATMNNVPSRQRWKMARDAHLQYQKYR